MGRIRWSAAIALGLVFAGGAQCDPPPQFCATDRYVAVSIQGRGLWVIELASGNHAGPRQRELEGVPLEMACAGEAVYVRTSTGVWAFDLTSADLAPSTGSAWRSGKRSKNHVAGSLKPGDMYKLPASSFRLAFARARLATPDDQEELMALFLVGPKGETLLFTLRYATITLDG
jgi:hypothetical protein